MEKIKENVFTDYYDMITKSWTYARLTKEEQTRLKGLFFNDRIQRTIRGTYIQRWETLHSIYESFLTALNYDPSNWREDTENV